MNNDSPQKAVLVVVAVALVCSLLVSAAAITLRPIQLENALVERSRTLVSLTGLVPAGASLDRDETLDAVAALDARVVEIDTGELAPALDPAELDMRAAAADAALGTPIPPALDVARLGRRSRFAPVYFVWDADRLDRVILPIHGQGMWSTLYGYLALDGDLETIADVTFYDQAETPGLGDQITRPEWHAEWRGKRLFDDDGELRLRVAPGAVADNTPTARFEVDGLTGATVTGDAVTALIAYWFGPHGYTTFLDRLESRPPAAPGSTR